MPRTMFPVYINAPGDPRHGELIHVTSVTRMEGLANKSFSLKHPETGEKVTDPAPPKPNEQEAPEPEEKSLDKMTKGELLTLAIEHDVEGAKTMNKEELVEALVELDLDLEDEDDG